MLIAQGRKRLGLLVGAGGPAGMKRDDGFQLIPAVAGLTAEVMDALKPTRGPVLAALWGELDRKDIEALLSRVRTLASVLGPTTNAHGLDAKGFATLGDEICEKIAAIVNVDLPTGPNPYSDLVSWIVGASRECPVEIFTTNYDLLFEEALERVKAPYFDGFTGGREAFFDPVSVAAPDLPARWTRLWKIHGSLGWKANDRGDIVRTGGCEASQLVFPAHLKYDQTQKAPYSAMLDRLQSFLANSGHFAHFERLLLCRRAYFSADRGGPCWQFFGEPVRVSISKTRQGDLRDRARIAPAEFQRLCPRRRRRKRNHRAVARAA